jgi:hypothetical protein
MSPRLTLEARLGNVPEANRVNAAISHLVSAIVRNRACGALALLFASSPFADALKYGAQSIMPTFLYSWPATFGNGASIGIVLITTRLWRTKVARQTIRKVPIHHSIPPRVLSRWGVGLKLYCQRENSREQRWDQSPIVDASCFFQADSANK